MKKKAISKEVEKDLIKLVVERIRDYGIPAMAGGATVAGISHFLSQRKREEERNEPSSDSVYVTVKSEEDKDDKKAEDPSATQYLTDAGVTVGSMIGGTTIGYLIVDKILKKTREKEIDITLDRAKKEYAQILSQRIEEDGTKSASEYLEFPNIETLCYAIVLSQESTEEKTAADPTAITMATSLPFLAALLTGIGTHHYWYEKQKNIQAGIIKKEKEESRKTPIKIKLRSEKDEEIRKEEEIEKRKEERTKRIEDKQREDEETPLEEQPQEGEVNDSYVLEDTKSAEETEETPFLPSEGGIANAIVSELAKEEKKKEEEVRRNAPGERGDKSDKTLDTKRDIETIDKNTVVIHTDDGDTIVEATGKDSRMKINKAKKIIAKTLAITQNIEE